MTLEKAFELYNKLESTNNAAKNFIAQANARYILFNVNEEKLPDFRSNLNEGLDGIALSYLSIGCCFAENDKIENALEPLEKGATLLEYNHLPIQNRNSLSKYFIIISALSYYASSNYSKSFVLLKDVEFETEVAQLTSLFLKKEYRKLFKIIDSILLSEKDDKEDEEEIDSYIHVSLFAKAISYLLEFIYSGNIDKLITSGEILKDLMTLLEIENEPSMWWVIRLFLIIIKGFENNSLWSIISPNLNPKGNGNSNRIVDDFIRGLLFKNKPVSELFLSQKLAMNLVFRGNGGVISLPTSSGKTRIAEVAILQSLLQNENSLVLYIAPFRSLAYEVEDTLNSSFSHLNYKISHLYGGTQFGAMDRTLIQDSNIIIATQEKAKALLRTGEDIIKRIKLVIIDEGHMLSVQQRDVINELFVEELKFYINRNEGKIFLLSAVLPNVKEIAKWITEEESNNIISDYRLSSQRCGILKFYSQRVDLKWLGEIQSDNYNFIKSHERKKRWITEKRKQEKEKIINFPSNKKQAIAATAIKLLPIGSVLIFVGKSESVFTYAKEVLFAFGDDPNEFIFENRVLWNEFILACEEVYGQDSKIFIYAKYGIICHNANIAKEVRILLERLMREEKVKIIISTTTLAQGVNLGVSTVIFGDIQIGFDINKPERERQIFISKRDFWNIAGRAGRAFIDTEGKILFALDADNKTERQIEKDEEFINSYFDKKNIGNAQSGFLKFLKALKQLAIKCNIDFDLLLQLISENNFSKLKTINGNQDKVVENIFDWIDDTILSLGVTNEENIGWIELHFKKSLAYIQSEQLEGISQDDVILFLKARNKAIREVIVPDANKRKIYSASGLPLKSIVEIDNQFENIILIIDEYINSDKDLENKIKFFMEMKDILIKLPSASLGLKKEIEIKIINEILKLWLSGIAMHDIKQIFKEEEVIELCDAY